MYTSLVGFMNTLNIISIFTEVSAQEHQFCFGRYCDKIIHRHRDRLYHLLEIIRSMSLFNFFFVLLITYIYYLFYFILYFLIILILLFKFIFTVINFAICLTISFF